MKRSRLLLITLIFVGTVSCDLSVLKDAIDNFVPVIALEPITTTGVIQLIDAATGELISVPTTVSFSQPNGGQVIDMYSDPMSSISISNGFVNFGISNNLIPSESNSISVLMTFTAAGYQVKTQRIHLNSTGSNPFVVFLIQLNNPPEGVVFQTQSKGTISPTSGTSGNVLLEPSGMPGPPGTNYSIGANLNIPSGIILKDANGTPLSGQLTAKMEYYDTSVPMAFEGLPEEVTSLAQRDGLLIMGYSALTITDASGRKAAGLDSAGSAKLRPDLDNPSISDVFLNDMIWLMNPSSNQNTIDYDPFIYTFNPISSQFLTFDPFAGVYSAPFTHNFVPNSWAVYGPVGFMNGKLEVIRNGNTGPINYEIFASSSRFSGVIPSDKSSVELENIYGEFTYSVRVSNSVSEYVIPHTFKNRSTVTVSMTPPPPSIVNVELNVQLRCSDPSKFIRVTNIPGASVQYRKVGAPSGTLWRQGQNLSFNYDATRQRLDGGRVTLNQVQLNDRYEVKIIYDTEEASSNVMMSGTSVTHTELISSDICK